MDKAVEERLEKLAPQIERFLELHPDEQEWLYPLLGRANRRAIAVAQEIQGHPLTYWEIAKLTDSHSTTVKGILYALERGGLAFRSGSSNRWTTPKGGRNRKLVRMD